MVRSRFPWKSCVFYFHIYNNLIYPYYGSVAKKKRIGFLLGVLCVPMF
jgi:hypothetical protein